ncbi:Gfo/Idh/MocA family protein [Curtobacterium flaccumfaciens]|uniref:Gfo/Idh/MocA family protein n=1 Tax=Curtobacterium flaccumfaciens TaxID=2035 RepID=UPI000FFED6F6|nr:Gfo/Idh/MocA family oxidoreductase [Curtobacterium flaccumfaciens]MCS0645666.1 Gfo/Idh/MocA family oxidoreductase [Curtobacterium flaccumfaciens pv. flaccumfaciens]MCS6525711.1 Gfo/Idh/MocA family oxidoreductase [Curtobacterium flaccumfaciens pv. flaccumfaciens]MCS6529293.1 Gfo/Idh/MocA family oxidoreductase [Curtobacterium flaccumfaciens pv. flaccumfaciens]NUU10447.1 Gfo/Idh/MocA family oxidoreductase [Curtobacterium flaccumfaciens]RXF84216.1 oxidoreductase [Curtobacterium flaccumfaciens p
MTDTTTAAATATDSTTRTGPVGVGVIGAGVISDQYLSNLTVFPDVTVRFIADIDLPRAAAQAEKWGVPGSGTVEELLADDDIEIVVNLTIPAAHVEVALQALAAGKHVWGEKPYALDRASAAELRDAAAAAGKTVSVAPDTFLGAGLQTALRTIRDGRIGTPLNGLTLFQSPGPESWHPSPEFLFAYGAGPLFDIGPYYITTLVQAFGPVKKVTATASKSRATRTIGSGPKAGTEFPVDVPTNHSALIEFENGGSAQSVFSFESDRGRTGFVEIAGETGTVVFPDPNNFDGDTELYVLGSEEPETIPAVGSTYSRGTGVVDLARSLRAGDDNRVPGALAFHVLDVMVSIAEAAERGEAVLVESTVSPSPTLPEGWDPAERTLA